MKVFVCATVVAVVMGFVMSASAQEEDDASLEDQIVVTYDEAPYVDAEGNVDYELGKDFAELVESYIDEDGTKWEVWLDEFGGHMWTEYLTTEGTRGDEDLFVPYYVVVYRSGLPYVYYTVPGTTCGYIEYASTCGTHCYKWNLCHDSSSRNCDPSNVTEIAARATSDYDYCDANYVGFYADPDDDNNYIWEDALDYDCWTVGGTTSTYDLDDTRPDGSEDYDPTENMVQWHYHVSGTGYYTQVRHQGPCII
jgi:hypothetical protein